MKSTEEHILKYTEGHLKNNSFHKLSLHYGKGEGGRGEKELKENMQNRNIK